MFNFPSYYKLKKLGLIPLNIIEAQYQYKKTTRPWNPETLQEIMTALQNCKTTDQYVKNVVYFAGREKRTVFAITELTVTYKKNINHKTNSVYHGYINKVLTATI